MRCRLLSLRVVNERLHVFDDLDKGQRAHLSLTIVEGHHGLPAPGLVPEHKMRPALLPSHIRQQIPTAAQKAGQVEVCGLERICYLCSNR